MLADALLELAAVLLAAVIGLVFLQCVAGPLVAGLVRAILRPLVGATPVNAELSLLAEWHSKLTREENKLRDRRRAVDLHKEPSQKWTPKDELILAAYHTLRKETAELIMLLGDGKPNSPQTAS